MTTIARRRRLAVVLILPFLLVLAGCGRFHADFEINDTESMDLALDVGINADEASLEYDSADEMCSELVSQEESLFGDVAPEPYEEDDVWGCRGEGYIDRADFGSEVELAEQDGELHFVLNTGSAGITEADLAMFGPQVDQLDFRVSFSFPGEVIESAGGEIDGDTVTYTDIGEFFDGVDIRAEAGGGFPWLIVIGVVLVIGFLVLVAIAVVVFLVIRSRRNRGGGTGSPGVPAAYSGAAGTVAPGAGEPGASPQGGQDQPWAQPPQPGGQDQPWGQPPQQGGQDQPWAQPPQQGGQDQPWGQPPQDPNAQRPPQPPGPGQQGGGAPPPQPPGW